jgi:hypothetical protein
VSEWLEDSTAEWGVDALEQLEESRAHADTCRGSRRSSPAAAWVERRR